MIKCPHCGAELTAEEIKALRAALNGSLTSEKKAKSSSSNGKKGGRPRKAAETNDKNK